MSCITIIVHYNSNNMVKIENLDFAYQKHKYVLSEINLQLETGYTYALLGKNGSGKTTLLNIINGDILSYKGKCTINNKHVSERKVETLQTIYSLSETPRFSNLRISEYLKIVKAFYPSYSKDIQNICIESFDLDSSAFLCKLSDGQKKKAAITIALAANTPLLLLDEPTKGLDIPSRIAFKKLLSSCYSNERTIVLSTHQVTELENLIDAVIILDNKKIIFNKTINEISQKLISKKLQFNEDALYTEISPIGQIGILKNLDDSESSISLELLFNMTLQNNELVKLLLTD